MRMWLVNVEYMCDAHLRQEHNDLHAINRRVQRSESTDDIICEPGALYERHVEVAKEMINRGMSHNSKLKKLKVITSEQMVWGTESLAELLAICPACRERVLNVEGMDTEKSRS